METVRTQIRTENPEFIKILWSGLTFLLVPQRTPSLPSAAPELHHLQKYIRKQVDKNKYLQNSVNALIVVSSPEGGAPKSSPSEARIPMSLCSRLWTRLCSWALSLSNVSTADCRVLAVAFSPRSTAICSDGINKQINPSDSPDNTDWSYMKVKCEYLIPQSLQFPVFVWD